MNLTNDNDVPLGFGMALAQNMDAMSYFSNLPDSRKKEIIQGTHNIRSKAEMQSYVNNMNKLS